MKYPNQNTIKKHYICNVETGEIIYKISKGNRKAGQLAGHKTERYINVGRKSFPAHCLIWIYVNGDIPDGMEIDHINFNGFDNRICNLRLVTREQQTQHRRTPKNNISGKKGVHFCNTQKKWLVRINVNGIRKQIGTHSNYQDAVKCREKAETLYYGEFACD